MNDNEKMTFYEEISSEFADKYCKSFKEEILQDEVTQPFWYSMYLERQRLKKLGIQKRIQIKENQNESEAYIPDERIQTTSTAGNKVTLIKKPVSVRKTYLINKNRKKVLTDYCQCTQCVVLESERKVDEYLCPYCGAIGTAESFIDGCDYCGAKFKVTDLGRKISAYNVFHDYEEDIKEKKKLYQISAFIAAMIVLLLYFISFASMGRSDILAGEAMLRQISKVVMLIGLGIFAAVFYAQQQLKKTYSERMVSNDELKKSEASITNFNKEEFVASLDYKLKTLHFAKSEKELGGFYQNNCESYLKLYENVAECNLKNCCITNYTADESYHYIDAEVVLDLLCLEKNNLVTRQEKMFVSLYKNKNEKTSSSIVSYSCDHCGGSISLLNGGKCSYCGKQLDLSLYDFAIRDIKSQWLRDGNKGRKNQEKVLKRMIAVISTVIICFNIPQICGSVYAGMEGIKHQNYLVYMVGNDIVPSFKNYGYAIIGDKSGMGLFKNIYTYEFINDYANNINDYAKDLVSDDNFEIVEESEDSVALERPERFGFGKIRITIQKKDHKYEIITKLK